VESNCVFTEKRVSQELSKRVLGGKKVKKGAKFYVARRSGRKTSGKERSLDGSFK
jgi:hypothetical protein